MPSTVYFLPWHKKDSFGEWINSINAAGHVSERDFTAIKIHFGETGNKGFIGPGFVRPLAESILNRNAFPFLTDANTIYVGGRADAVHHSILAHQHGFNLETCGCPVIIADGLRGNAGVSVKVALKHFKSVMIANAVHYANSFIFMSHFKGHEISGFGGTIKNMGMGCGTRAGKYAMHDSVVPKTFKDRCTACGECVKWCSGGALELKKSAISLDKNKCTGCGECILSCPSGVFMIPWDEKTSAVQEKIVEYAYGVIKGKKHFSINFLNHITKFCDCYETKEKPLMADIGIMAGADPVALDQASADMVNGKFGGDFFAEIFPQINWQVQLEYAEKLGLGRRSYKIAEFK